VGRGGHRRTRASENPFAPSGQLRDAPAAMVAQARRPPPGMAGRAARQRPGADPLPVGVLPAAVAAGACALDAWRPRLDLAAATGQPSPLTDPLARTLHDAATQVVEQLRRVAYGPALQPEPGDSEAATLLKYLGRRPTGRPRLGHGAVPHRYASRNFSLPAGQPGELDGLSPETARSGHGQFFRLVRYPRGLS